MSFKIIRILGFCFLLTGCAYFSRSTTEPVPPTSAYPAPDPEMVQQLDTYRDSLNDVMGRKVATVQDTLRFGKPEAALNNIVADALRFQAASTLRQFVHVGIIGEDSFKLFFVPGELTVGDVYEFMPYNNHLVVLSMNGEQLKRLIEQVAELGGAPISGVRFRIDENGEPNSILVNAEVINSEAEYLVATSSWAVNGGDKFPVLWNVSDRTDLDLSIQDAYINYFRNQVELTASTDGRIRK
ncbi:MAG: 5'-nucleotidase [Balneolaceae bacterium]|nr:5'-nucleotidase [Balneolaceae bacterium]